MSSPSSDLPSLAIVTRLGMVSPATFLIDCRACFLVPDRSFIPDVVECELMLGILDLRLLVIDMPPLRLRVARGLDIVDVPECWYDGGVLSLLLVLLPLLVLKLFPCLEVVELDKLLSSPDVAFGSCTLVSDESL